jgi:phospholipid transport system substrate-binding protein
VQFRGVWLAITQQQDFVSTIDNAGGDAEPLIRQLQGEAAPASSKR